MQAKSYFRFIANNYVYSHLLCDILKAKKALLREMKNRLLLKKIRETGAKKVKKEKRR